MRNAEVIRQWQVLREIESRRTGITIHELAAIVRVSTRTIRRDLQALQEAGFAVYDEGADNETKRWRIDTAPFRAVQEGLTVADVAALYLGRAVVESLPGWPMADELAGAFRKIEAALNPRTRDFLATLPHVLSAKASPRGTRATTPLADITRRLFDAARGRRVIEMRYFSAASNRAKSYQVHPYRLALAHGGVYLVAWVPAYNEFRTFAAERIERLSVSEETFRKTRELPADLFGSSMGAFSAPAERIEVEFDAAVAPFVRGRIWHDTQRITEHADGRIGMTLDVSNDWALRSWLLGFGAGVRVVAPAALADTMARELAQALERYRSPEANGAGRPSA